jgi:hypothetical protein
MVMLQQLKNSPQATRIAPPVPVLKKLIFLLKPQFAAIAPKKATVRSDSAGKSRGSQRSRWKKSQLAVIALEKAAVLSY